MAAPARREHRTGSARSRARRPSHQASHRRVARRVGVAVEAIVLRYRAKWLLRTKPLDCCLEALSPRPVAISHPRPEGELVEIEIVTDALLRRWWPTRTTCLPRALARYAMLRRRGVPAVFEMGVRDEGDDLQGHAWVSLDGEPIMERESTDYPVTFRYPDNS